MKQFMLAAFLIAAPVAGFSFYQHEFAAAPPAPAAISDLGDLTFLKVIVTDTTALSDKGDLAAAKQRITDLETAWDDAEATMRPKNEVLWGKVDGATDGALHALRAETPDSQHIKETLQTLLAVLDNPAATAQPETGVQMVANIAVTDASGHALPCEVMIKSLQTAVSAGKFSEANKANVEALQAKALERCNADDDAHADAFSAQALALSQ